ncbi:hypothetical protein KC357_g110 [Hortaea werneckii]|nr:hypothetical protein KC357_g110 [Hortaea werneckii]
MNPLTIILITTSTVYTQKMAKRSATYTSFKNLRLYDEMVRENLTLRLLIAELVRLLAPLLSCRRPSGVSGAASVFARSREFGLVAPSHPCLAIRTDIVTQASKAYRRLKGPPVIYRTSCSSSFFFLVCDYFCPYPLLRELPEKRAASIAERPPMAGIAVLQRNGIGRLMSAVRMIARVVAMALHLLLLTRKAKAAKLFRSDGIGSDVKRGLAGDGGYKPCPGCTTVNGPQVTQDIIEQYA